MLRGRRVVNVVILLFVFLFKVSAYAAEMGATVTVPLSSLWERAIEDRSVQTVDTSTHQNVALFSVQTKGINDMIMPGETIQILLFKDDKFISSQKKVANKEGLAQFTFIYTKGGNYRVISLDIGHEFPFVINTLSFRT